MRIFILTKLSIAAMLIIFLSAILRYFKVIDNSLLKIIIIAFLVFELILFLIASILVLLKENRIKNTVKIIRYKFNDKNVKARTDIIPTNLTTTNPRRNSIFKLFLEVKNFENVPEFGVLKSGKRDVGTDVTNISTSIEEDIYVLYADILMRPHEKLNFQFKNDTEIKSFFLGEIYIP